MTILPGISSLAVLLQQGKTSALQVAKEAIRRAENLAPLHLFASIHKESALQDAQLADERRKDPNVTLLNGIPIAIKDNIDEAHVVCAAGSRAYRDRIPESDAEVVVRLRRAGAVIVGRANMHELADGVTSENELFGNVQNPWRTGFHPGGSSGGSAAAVATGCVAASLGTDTGGSIRIPASLCGVVGFKPSHGLVPTSGVVPLSTTLDTVGPISCSVRDAAVLLEVLAGASGHPFLTACDRPLGKCRLGVLEGFGIQADAEVGMAFESALKLLSNIGCELVPVRIPQLSEGLSVLGTLCAYEAGRAHRSRLEEKPEAFSEKVRADLLRGLKLKEAHHRRALEKRASLRDQILCATKDFDILASPTTPHPAKPIGSSNPHTYLSFTHPFNLTGQPAVSIPMGLVDNLPVGLQLIGRPNADGQVLQLASRFEEKVYQ
jgi:aspartyl-tRNA(Asn)/glutamyl-tRNA(Gln) amidotransferase subunit A